MDYSLKEEILTKELILEMLPLIEEHRKEVTTFIDMPLNPNIDGYLLIYSMGMYKMYIARDKLNTIIAYIGYFIQPNFHYQDYTYATQDVIYVRKSRRGLMMGSKLITFTDKALKELGVNVVTQHVKVKQDFGVLLQRLGYECKANIYMKRLQ